MYRVTKWNLQWNVKSKSEILSYMKWLVARFTAYLGRVPFDQKFRFEFPKFLCVEWNGIFHQAGPILFNSRLSTFPTKNYLKKCWRIMMKVAVLNAVLSCFMCRRTRTQNSTLPRTFLVGEYANRANRPTGNSERPVHNFHQILAFSFSIKNRLELWHPV